MAQKFLTDIEVTRGLVDSSGDLGVAGQVLSSTGTGTNWITNESNSTVVYLDEFTGDNSTVGFTLSVSVTDENITQVYIDGVYQNKNTYSVSNTTLTFSTAPPLNADIEVITFSTATTADDLQAGVVIIPVKNTHTASIAKGQPVYITGNVGASTRLQIAPADASNSAKMPAAGLLLQTLAVNAEGYVVTGGYLRNITTDIIDGTSTTSNDTVYVKAGGGLTMTKPTGANLIQNIAKVARSASGNSGSLLVSSILRTNDVPNITNDYFWLGNSSGVATPTEFTSSVRGLISTSGNALSYNSSTGVITSNYEESPTFTGNVVIDGTLDVNGSEILIGTNNTRFAENNLRFKASSDAYIDQNTVGQAIRFRTSSSSSLDTEALIIASSGAATFSGDITLDDNSGASPSLYLKNGNNNFWRLFCGSSEDLTFRLGTVTKLEVDSSGNATFAGIVTANGFKTTSGSTDYSLLTRNSSNTAVYIQQAGAGNILDVRYGSQAAGQGTSAMVVNGTGSVGINTTSPTNLLNIKGNGNSKGLDIHHSNGNIVAQLIHGGSGDEGQLKLYDSNSETVRISGENNIASFINSGNVGIGTSSPDVKLEINGGADAIAKITGTTTAARFDYKTNSHHRFWQLIESDGRFRFYDQTNTSERLTIDSSGNVILTSNGDATQLQIKRASASQDNGLSLQDQNGNKHAIFNLEGTTTNNLQIGASNQMIFYTSSSLGNPPTAERFRITGQGRLGVNTSSPSEMFSVASGNVAITNGNSFMVGGANGDTIVGRLKNTSGVLNLEGDSTRSIRFGSVTNGEVVRIDNVNNRVGIGTTSPSGKLEVFRPAGQSSNPQLILSTGEAGSSDYSLSTDVTAAGDFCIVKGNSNVAANVRLKIDSSGNVGIGTTSPAGKFNSYISATRQLTHNGNGGDLSIISDNNSSPVMFIKGTGSADLLNVFDNTTEVFTILDGGNVGIGTTSPSATLHVATDAGIKLFNDNTYGYISIGSSGLTGQYPYLRVDSFRSDGSGYFWAFGHETPGGVKSIKMLINDGSSDQVIVINSLAISRFTSNEFNSSYPSFSTGVLIRSNDTSYFNGGNVGIGTTLPGSKLHIKDASNRNEATSQFRIEGNGYSAFQWLDGDAYYIGQNSNSRSLRIYSGSNEAAGVQLSASGTSWGSYSDERLKENIEDLGLVSDKIEDIRCITYNRSDIEDSKKTIGFIAQDFIGKFDEVLDKSKIKEDGEEYYSIKYTETIPILLKAIQELKADNDSLRARIEALENN